MAKLYVCERRESYKIQVRVRIVFRQRGESLVQTLSSKTRTSHPGKLKLAFPRSKGKSELALGSGARFPHLVWLIDNQE